MEVDGLSHITYILVLCTSSFALTLIIYFFRKGAPFYQHFQEAIQQLDDFGLLNHWLQDIIDRRVRERRVLEEVVSTDTPYNSLVSPIRNVAV